MLSAKFIPAWNQAGCNYAADVLEQYQAACQLSDEEAASVVEFFKSREFKPHFIELDKLNSSQKEHLGEFLSDATEQPSHFMKEAAPGSFPRIEIDQKVLLEMASLIELSQPNEVQAILGVVRDDANSLIQVRHLVITPKQRITKSRVGSEATTSDIVSRMSEVLGLSQNECYVLNHGQFHSHVEFLALPSEVDLHSAKNDASGQSDTLKLHGIEWKRWWLGCIGNLDGDLYLHLFDIEKGIFICDLPWEMAPMDEPVSWLKARFPVLFSELSANVYRNPDDLENRPFAPGEIKLVAPERIKPERGSSTFLKIVLFVLVAFLSIALYFDLSPSGGGLDSSKTAVVANVSSVAIQAPVDATPVVSEPVASIASPASVDAGKTDMATPSPVVVATEPEPKHDAVVVPPVVTEPLVPMPVASIASPASVDAGKKEPEPSVSKPTPRLEEWQEKLVKEYEGLKMLPMQPRKIDMAQFDRVPTKLLRKMAGYTWKSYAHWMQNATYEEGGQIPDVVFRVFEDQIDADISYLLVTQCLISKPDTNCIGVTRTQMEEHIHKASTYLGDNAKPFEVIYKMRLKQGRKRR